MVKDGAIRGAKDRKNESSKTKVKFFFIVAISFVCISARAQIFSSSELSADFTNSAELVTNVYWSTPNRITISTKGLGWDGTTNEYRDFWIQSVPVAIGTSWRPAGSTSVEIDTSPEAGELFVRYSPDKKHWSSWQALEDHHGMIEVPRSQSEQYYSLCSQYSRMDVPWSSDEEAAVKWILQREPDFFEKNLPFVGYVQFRMEGSLSGVQRIQKIKMTLSWGISGLSSIPKDPNARKNRDGPWRFEVH